jgi:hypothetical protein
MASRVKEKSRSDPQSPSDLLAKVVKQAARMLRHSERMAVDESSIQALETIRKRQEEHEEQRRRISAKINNGARLSRNL